MDELVKRLHRYSENCVAYKLYADFADAVQQAADAIEELQKLLDGVSADNDALCKRIDELHLTAESYRRSMEAWADETARAHDMIPRWIPVTERLPSAHELVLIYNPGYLMTTGLLYEDGRWRVRSVDYPDTPTHWMLLPQPPKEE